MVSSSSDPATMQLAEGDVAAFLRRHPDFLARHPELLVEIAVPHACGGAVSLVEYQVGVLRDQVRDLRQRMQQLLRAARTNEELSARQHRLTLELMGCNALDEVLTRLYHGLHEEFRVDLATVRLLCPAREAADAGLGELAGDHRAIGELLEPVLRSGRPLCGRLREEQVGLLFPGRAAEVASGALVALGELEPFGVLALGSRAGQRFHPGLGTVFRPPPGEAVRRAPAPHRQQP